MTEQKRAAEMPPGPERWAAEANEQVAGVAANLEAFFEERDRIQAEVKRLTAERDAAVELLREYGSHRPGGGYFCVAKCKACAFLASLKATENVQGDVCERVSVCCGTESQFSDECGSDVPTTWKCATHGNPWPDAGPCPREGEKS